MSKIILCDIDGTVANNSHRQIYVRNKPKNWKAYNQNMSKDTPIKEVLWLLSVLENAPGDYVQIVFLSGREETHRETTISWLDEYTSEFGFQYQGLYMRPAKDYRDDSIVKYELWQKVKEDFPNDEIMMVLDDRDRVVKMWRENGLRCMQVDYGDF